MELVIQLPVFAGIEDFYARKIENYAKVIVCILDLVTII